MSHRTYSDDGGVLIKLREGGCFDNLKYGKADRINLGESPDAVACAGKVITANRNCECSIYFEFDTKTGFCGCGAVGGNECKGDAAAVGRTSAVYQLSGPSPSCPTTLPGGAALPVQGARLKRLPNSGMLYASTRKAFDKTFELAALSVLRWAAAKGDAVKMQLQRKLAHMAVTYIMTTSGEKRDTGMFLDLASTPEFDAVTGIARVLPKRMTDHVDDKRNYGRLAKQAGVEGTDSAVPRTFESTADAVKVLSADPAACKYVFIKDVHGSGGTGISVRRTADLKDIKIGPHQIIQEGVTKVVLVEGRSLKIRTYLVVYCGKLYLSRYWGAFKGSSLYDPDKAESEDDLNRQLVSQHFNHSMSKNDYWKANGGRMLIAEDAPLRKEWTAAIVTATTMMAPVFDTIVAATTNDPYRYHVLGLDAIVRKESEEYSVQIIEANPFPDLTPNHDGPDREGACTVEGWRTLSFLQDCFSSSEAVKLFILFSYFCSILFKLFANIYAIVMPLHTLKGVGERSVDGTTSEVRVIASVLRLLFGMETEDLIELLPASSA